MSQEDKHIDNLFQEKLSDRNFDGPPADFLNDLNQRLDAKPVVSKGWIWMIFLNFFIIGLFIANASIDWTSSKTAQVENQIEHEEKHTSKEGDFNNEYEQMKGASANESLSNTESTEENKVLNKTKENASSNEINNSAETSSGIKVMDKQKESFSGTANMDSGVKNKMANQSNNKTQEGSSSENSSKNKTASNNTDDSTYNGSSVASNKTTNTGKNNSSSDQIDKSVAEKSSDQTNRNKTRDNNTVTNKDNVSLNGTESLSPYVSFSAIYAPDFDEVDHTISTKDFPEFPNRWNSLIAAENNEPTEKPEVKDNPDKRMFEIQLQGGATQWNFKTLGTNDSYVNQIDQAGTAKWTPNFGLGFNMNFNNISIGTGLNYAKFKTENLFEFTEINTYDSTYIGGYNANVTYDSLGNPIDTTYTPYYDSTTVTDTSINVTPITNQYEWIQIPIHFGYRFNLNKWAIIPRVGMNVGLGIRQSTGEYPSEDYNGLQTVSPVKWNLNLHTSLEVRRDFGNWHAFGKFNYQRNLTPTIDNALFERKFNGIGFNFGVGYSF